MIIRQQHSGIRSIQPDLRAGSHWLNHSRLERDKVVETTQKPDNKKIISSFKPNAEQACMVQEALSNTVLLPFHHGQSERVSHWCLSAGSN